MKTRSRDAIDRIPDLTMTVRTMQGVGAVLEQFEPHSLDPSGVMLVLKGQVDGDAPIRVFVGAREPIARKFCEARGLEPHNLKRNEDGSFQLFANWLKVKWRRKLDDAQLDAMGANHLLWEAVENWGATAHGSVVRQANAFLKKGLTTNVEVSMVLKALANGDTPEHPFTQEGFQRLARGEADLNIKLIYLLLSGVEYGDYLRTVVDFKSRYVRDPFQKRYGVLHGAQALNQDGESFEANFSLLRELAA